MECKRVGLFLPIKLEFFFKFIFYFLKEIRVDEYEEFDNVEPIPPPPPPPPQPAQRLSVKTRFLIKF